MRRYPPMLWRVGWRFLTRHTWQTGLMILGIALGVAVVVAVDLANLSAARSFELSAEAVAGKSTHQITGGPQGLDDRLYVDLRRAGLGIPMAPIVRDTVVSPQLGGRPLQLLGIDPFAEGPFRSYLGGAEAPPVEQLASFLVTPGAVFLSSRVAERYQLAIGSSLTLEIGGWERTGVVAGLLEPVDALSRRTLDGMILVDIATAQELTGRLGRLDQIDLLIDPHQTTQSREEIENRLRAQLPAGATLEPAVSRSGALDQLTGAFRVNLTALSLLALLVGLFLIYNTMTFSVVQRRALFGTLRCLGVTRGEIFLLVGVEALAVGVIGSAAGLGLGILLSRTTTAMILQTINDLYFSTTIQEVGIPASGLLKGFLVGILATLLAAAVPAWEAAGTSPRTALMRSNLEGKARRFSRLTSYAGIILAMVGLAVFALPTRDLVTGFTGTLMVVVGFALQAGVSLQGLTHLSTPLLARVFGILGKMAPRSLTRSLSRTAVAIAALMVAVSVTVGVGLMIESFRYTVIAWLAQTLQGDIYVSAPTQTATHTTNAVDPEVIEKLLAWPGVMRVDQLRQVQVDTPSGPIQVAATNNPGSGSERLFLSRDGTPDEVWKAMLGGSVILSEPLANRLGLPMRGGSLMLNTPSGPREFPVAGVFSDYTSSQGVMVMSLDLYRRLWGDPAITAVTLRLASPGQADEFAAMLQDSLVSEQRLVIRSNAVLKQEVLQVFDRTFAITRALQILTTVVAFIGVLNALLLLQLEKAREVGIMRALGLTGSQLQRLVFLETGLMGLAAGILAMPTGYVLSLILIYVINRRSFGWTLQSVLEPEPFLLALAIAVGAALLAGYYPAKRLSRMPASEAIRYE